MEYMTVAVSIVGIFVASITAIVVAYLHRKQMRQLEAFRLNHAVGLVPPDAAFTRWWRRRWHYLFLAPSLAGAIFEASKAGPPTRFSILAIAFHFCAFAVGLSVMISMEISVKIVTTAFRHKDGA